MKDHTYLVTPQLSKKKVKKIAMLAGEIRQNSVGIRSNHHQTHQIASMPIANLSHQKYCSLLLGISQTKVIEIRYFMVIKNLL